MVYAAAAHGIDMAVDIFMLFELSFFPGEVVFGGHCGEVVFSSNHGGEALGRVTIGELWGADNEGFAGAIGICFG
jgi:hypothetical protein